MFYDYYVRAFQFPMKAACSFDRFLFDVISMKGLGEEQKVTCVLVF
jgi:hypothetical protein